MHVWIVVLIIRKQMDNRKSECFCNHRVKDNFVIIFIFAAEEIRSFFVSFYSFLLHFWVFFLFDFFVVSILH